MIMLMRIYVVFVEEIWLWGNTVLLDSSLHLYGVVLSLDQWNSIQLL
jgi:hypothetical protein